MDRLYLKRSVNDQEADCRSSCEQQGWSVTKVIADVNRSASQWRTREREGFEEVLDLISSKTCDAFVTWEPSRVGREMAAYIQLRAACQQAGVLYLTKGRVYDFSRSDDAFMMGLEFLTAEKDAATIRERQLRTVHLNAQKGRPHGRLPYGYRRVYDKNTGVLLRQEIDPAQAALIREAATDVLSGVPTSQIIRRLNESQTPTPHGPASKNSRGWAHSSLRQILMNPTIAGLRVYRGEIIGEADWPAIIPKQRWEEVQAVLADKARRTRHVPQGNHSYPKWLLSHIAKCGYCGRPLVRVAGAIPRKDGSPRNSYGCGHTSCRKISIDIPRTDEFVICVLLGWFSTPENLTLLSAPEDQWVEKVKNAHERIVDIERRIQEAAAAYASGEIGMAVLASLEKQLIPELDQARRDVAPPVADENLTQLLTADDIEQAWNRLDLVSQRRLIKTLLDIRIVKAPQTGGKFSTERIKVAPRFAPTSHYQWQRKTGDSSGKLNVAGTWKNA